ncbi:MAG: glycosyl hydrolase family 18 protein [Chloroflexota bacterium]
MTFTAESRKAPQPRVILLLAVLALVTVAYGIWSPGQIVEDGRNDLGYNGIWLQHGWLGDDAWFVRYDRDLNRFRDVNAVRALAKTLSEHNIRDIFPHLCPCASDGRIAQVDHAQAELFLGELSGFRVLPWVGGVLNDHVFLESAHWREAFTRSIVGLLVRHPGFAGVHLNIEPMPSGNEDFLRLLEEINAALPPDKLLSVAAFPPPTIWHWYPNVHWDEEYFAAVSQRVDQVAVMMYDTGIRLPKLYQSLMASWTRKVLDWPANTQVLLGVPVYDDEGVGYHFPRVENLRGALLGIHAGLNRYDELPSNYQGVAIYCEWEMDDDEWDYLSRHFNKPTTD